MQFLKSCLNRCLDAVASFFVAMTFVLGILAVIYLGWLSIPLLTTELELVGGMAVLTLGGFLTGWSFYRVFHRTRKAKKDDNVEA